MQTVADGPQCLQNIHIGQLMTISCHCINSTLMEDINKLKASVEVEVYMSHMQNSYSHTNLKTLSHQSQSKISTEQMSVLDDLVDRNVK